MSLATLIELFIRLRWRLLRGAFRQGGAQRVAIVVGMAAMFVAAPSGNPFPQFAGLPFFGQSSGAAPPTSHSGWAE